MNIHSFPFGESNLAYLIWNGGEAAAVDGGAAEEIIRFCREQGLVLRYVLNTHDHADHTPGNSRLLEAGFEGSFPLLISPGAARDQGKIFLGQEALHVLAVPGHTEDSVVFFTGGWIISGDTLFTGTVGNCYTGNYELYFDSLSRLLELPSDLPVYPGHDLFDYAVGVIKTIDPGNPYLTKYITMYNKSNLWTTLEAELRVNPFIRWNDSSLDAYRAALKQPVETPYQRFRAMMTIH
ncbi:MAG: MBL fold metallo-hydrolase [Spirochaetales bacterium]|jgi:hydroxyacylglutathione hydrolase|nr:MBL fold metallo-hydrolase [Spirochaetales bacterium]